MSATVAKQQHSALQDVRQLQQLIDKYLALRRLHDDHPDEYFTLLLSNTEEVLPYIYTPTVGEACQHYHQLPGLHPHGLYLSLTDKGSLLQKLQAVPKHKVSIVVVTDGERILGLGDLGTGGMGISEGKITLYTAAAGVAPDVCLPVCLDVGTNTKSLLQDPKYPGLRHPRATGAEYDAFVDEFMAALQAWQAPRTVLVQFEDFGNTNAFRLLQRYQCSHCAFNDDIQGTAAITLAALLAAGSATGVPLKDQRVLFYGAGEAGTGIGELIAYCIHRRTGLSLQEARQKCFFMDSKGLVCASRKAELAHHKLPFAHDVPHVGGLEEAVQQLHPTALIGVSAQGGAFTEGVVRAMAQGPAPPAIFPLSNPTTKSECTFEQAWRWTGGRLVFASGSPFPPLTLDAQGNLLTSGVGQAGGRTVRPAQANNAYIFPALGLAALSVQGGPLMQEAFLVAAEALAQLTDPAQVLAEGQLFPPFSRILAVSVHVAAAVARHLASSGAGVRPKGCEPGVGEAQAWLQHVQSCMWPPARAQLQQQGLLAVHTTQGLQGAQEPGAGAGQQGEVGAGGGAMARTSSSKL